MVPDFVIKVGHTLLLMPHKIEFSMRMVDQRLETAIIYQFVTK